MIALFGMVPAWASAQRTVEVGGRDELAEGANAYKLNTYVIGRRPVRLELLEAYLRPLTPHGGLDFVAYQRDGDSWDLVWDSGEVVPEDGEGLKASPDPGLVLAAHETYALGVWFGKDSFIYGWSDSSEPLDLWWGVQDDVLWSDNGTVPDLPDPIADANGGTPRFDQRLTVSLPRTEDFVAVGGGCDQTGSRAAPVLGLLLLPWMRRRR